MSAKSPTGDESALPLSPKRRIEDEGIDLDSALNPAKHYPRKRVAVAVSPDSGVLIWTLIRVQSAKSVDFGRRNATRKGLAASALKQESNVCIARTEPLIRSKLPRILLIVY